MKRILILLFLLFDSFLMCAQTDTLYKSEVSELMQMKQADAPVKITSATKTEQEIAQAPNLVNVVLRKQILQYGYISLNDILFRQVGTSVSQDFDRTTVSMRGTFENWNNNHWLMLIDGVPFNGNTYGSAFTQAVTPLVFSQSVEILRGAGSALYGGGAMHGVVSMNTTEVSDLKGNSEGRVRFGAQGEQIYDVMAGAENNNVSILAAFNRYQNQGYNYESYDGSGRINQSGTLSKFKTNHALSSNYFFSKIQFKNNLRGLSLQYHEQNWNFGTGTGYALLIPEQDEELEDFRRAFSVRYRTDPDKKWALEAVARYQCSGHSWNLRLLPDSTYWGATLYPHGISEFVKTYVDDVFTRLQFSYETEKFGTFLAGTENTFFYYNGDKAHQSNIDLNSTFTPNTENQITPANAFFALAQHHLVWSKAFFAQYMSPLWFKKLSLTAGLRFDDQSFDYTDVWDENRIKSKSYSRFTPRFSLVYALSRNFYLKAIAGRAFRLPSFSEVFAANTFAIASNINQLSPETVTTYELAADWKIRPQITWRGNIFYTDFQNLVAYSNSNNALATNVYSQRTGGFETEIDWQFGNFSGFMNAHFVKLFGEEVLDKTVSEMTTLTWIPAHVLKAGVVYQREKWYASLNGMYQGEVKRRDSDRLPVSYNGREVQTSDYRPANVPAWFSLNARLSYRAFTSVEFSVQANHALNTERYLLKTLSYPFDYQASKRMLLLEVRMTY